MTRVPADRAAMCSDWPAGGARRPFVIRTRLGARTIAFLMVAPAGAAAGQGAAERSHSDPKRNQAPPQVAAAEDRASVDRARSPRDHRWRAGPGRFERPAPAASAERNRAGGP